MPDFNEVWHAGLSKWKNYKNLNKNSIGVEITNPGHQYGYKNFSRNKFFSKKLLKFN